VDWSNRKPIEWLDVIIRRQAPDETPPYDEKQSALSSWVFVFAVFAASRLFYIVSGLLLVGVVPVEPFHRESSDVPFGAMSIWAHYDGDHYVNAALNGYSENGGASPAFFPLYPLIVRFVVNLVGGPLLPSAVSSLGVAVSLSALPLAFWFVYRIAEDAWGTQSARTTVLTLAFFPTAFFFNAVYSESLFLLFSAGALWAARVRKDLLLACMLAGLATATRNVGIFLLIPLALAWWRDRAVLGWRVVYLAVAPSGLFAYSCFLWLRFGEPLLFLSAQGAWGRSFGGLVGSAVAAGRAAGKSARPLLDPGTYQPLSFEKVLLVLSGTNYLYNALFLLFAVIVLVAGIKHLPAELSLYAATLVLVPAFFGASSNPLMGEPRYLLVAFPLFIVLGIVLQSRRLLAAWVAVSALCSLPFVALFVNWYFVA
jgi:hypothetical protein